MALDWDQIMDKIVRLLAEEGINNHYEQAEFLERLIDRIENSESERDDDNV